jgi:cell division protein FtsI/penicillin-binding protein 2
MSDPGLGWRVTLRRRIVVAAGLLGLWVGINSTRLQIFRSADLTARAARSNQAHARRPARGDILDRRGHLLATSVDVDSIYAVPSEITTTKRRPKLCDAFGDCSARERKRSPIASRISAFAYVRRRYPQTKRVASPA